MNPRKSIDISADAQSERTALRLKIDQHVGKRIRFRRVFLKMTQERVADMLDVSCQQIQSYERGASRIGASRLYELAYILDVDLEYFYDGFSAAEPARDPVLVDRHHDDDSSDQESEAALELFKLLNENCQSLVVDLMRQMVNCRK